MKVLQIIALILTTIGALNWGMVAIFDIDLVATIFGDRNLVSIILYCVIAIAGLVNLGLLVDLFEEK